ncbi:MAG: thioredoxin family protein [Bacteroidales bacterium]|nr:thioredoxin family protein [Bacteroidales bacterium]
MKKFILISIVFFAVVFTANGQAVKVYDENIDPMAQIDKAVSDAAQAGKNVICQVGGNWCSWCLMFADFITKDADIAKVIDDNYVYIHVNYPRKGAAENLLKRLGNPGRFGYPALVVLDGKGGVIHIQDSSFLEEGKGYNKDKVLRFLKCWTPSAI